MSKVVPIDQRSTLAAALAYARRGWYVFPLHGVDSAGQCTCGAADCSDAGKHPTTRGGLRDATRDEAQIRRWWSENSQLNVAIATGEKSGITVLDIDIGDKGGDATWAELNKEPGEPDTLYAITGSGGIHFYFLYNSALNTSANTLGPGVDCRNDGGYVVAPPSRHRSGGAYAWAEPDAHLAALPKHLSKRKERRGRPRANDPTRKKYTIEQVATMLEFVPADDRDLWRNVGIILGREFNRAEAAWDAYVEWSNTWDGKKGRNHDAIMAEAFQELSQTSSDSQLTLATIVHHALAGGWAPALGQVPVENFLYYAPGNNFIYRPTGAFWPAESVDAAVSPINENGELTKPSIWLKANRLITSMTKDPALEDEVSHGYDCRDGAVVEAQGSAIYNAYLPPSVCEGDARLAKPWVEHVRRVFNRAGDADQFLDYMAHRVQQPGEKPRFALLIAGEQGVGKDTAISMCYPALGVWNVANIDPEALESSFNEFAASVLMVVSEAANHAEMSKWAFNERMKVLIAGTPDFMKINQKYGAKFTVRLHCGVIITTNHMTSGLFIPHDDRRYDVIACASRGEMGLADTEKRAQYFEDLWHWFIEENGGEHIAAFLAERNISGFRPATGQRQTDAHREVVAAGMGGDEWIIDALDALDNPLVLRFDALWAAVERTSPGEFSKQQFMKRAGHALPRCGYQRLVCHGSADGRWSTVVEGKRTRTAVYYKPEEISIREASKQWKEMPVPF